MQGRGSIYSYGCPTNARLFLTSLNTCVSVVANKSTANSVEDATRMASSFARQTTNPATLAVRKDIFQLFAVGKRKRAEHIALLLHNTVMKKIIAFLWPNRAVLNDSKLCISNAMSVILPDILTRYLHIAWWTKTISTGFLLEMSLSVHDSAKRR